MNVDRTPALVESPVFCTALHCEFPSLAQLEYQHSVEELNLRHLHLLERELLVLELHDHRSVDRMKP